jgi:YhcH/YjgK/YiaL family protein
VIYDKFENLDQYFGEDHPVYEAVVYARDKAGSMPVGDHDLDGDRLSARVQAYSTQPVELRQFESHRKYTDVQVMLEGCERQDVAPAQDLIPIGEFDEAKDVVKLEAPELFSTIHLEPGWFVVYFPQDNHRPNCCIGEPANVRKVCMKVKL